MSLERNFKTALSALLRIVVPSPHPAPPTLLDARRILVIRQHDQLGDMLCVVPLLRALGSKYPQANISLLASPVNASVMLNSRYLQEVIVFDKREMLGRLSLNVSRILTFVRELRSRRFDAVIVPATVSTSFTSDLLAFLSGAPLRLGASSVDGSQNPTHVLYTHSVALDWRSVPHRHQTLRNLDIARDLGLSTPDLRIEMTLSSAEREEGKTFVARALADMPFGIGVHPGAGKTPNRWPAVRFAEVSDALAREFNAHTFVTFGPMDEGPIQEYLACVSSPYTLLKLMPIRVVASILSRLRLVITNDTGIMHVAAAVGVPVLSLFGPTDAGQWAPNGEEFRYICGKEGKITNIGTEEVLRNAREMLLGSRTSITRLVPER